MQKMTALQIAAAFLIGVSGGCLYLLAANGLPDEQAHDSAQTSAIHKEINMPGAGYGPASSPEPLFRQLILRTYMAGAASGASGTPHEQAREEGLLMGEQLFNEYGEILFGNNQARQTVR